MDGRTDGPTDGRMDGRKGEGTDGVTGGWMDGRTDGWLIGNPCFKPCLGPFIKLCNYKITSSLLHYKPFKLSTFLEMLLIYLPCRQAV